MHCCIQDALGIHAVNSLGHWHDLMVRLLVSCRLPRVVWLCMQGWMALVQRIPGSCRVCYHCTCTAAASFADDGSHEHEQLTRYAASAASLPLPQPIQRHHNDASTTRAGGAAGIQVDDGSKQHQDNGAGSCSSWSDSCNNSCCVCCAAQQTSLIHDRAN
jgi:hypothetical protein